MDLLQHALQEKLTHIDEERGRWQQYANEYAQAEQNLIDFRESLQKDILVPIGTKALMPGKLYHTNEIFVGMYSGLFVKCSSHKAIELCQHRLKRSKEHLAALDGEFKMYKDRIELPMDEDAFRNLSEAQEIIEEYNEDAELQWREQHKIRVREHKQREAAERCQRQKLVEAPDAENIMEILERAELMEELENELEQLNVVDDEHLQQHLQTHSTNGLINGENGSGSVSHNGDDETDDEDFSDDIVPDEFQQINRVASNMSNEEKLQFYENHLREIADYLSTRKFSKFEDLKELADKRGVQECLRNAIGEISEEMAKCATQPKCNIEVDVMNVQSDAICTLSPPDGRKCPTVAEFKQLEQSYLNRSKSVALVFYKSQLRSVMKSIASCSKDAHLDHVNDKRELYEYINDSIDRLRAEILLEKQAKLEEKFVDDDTDTEALADDDDVDIEDNEIDDNMCESNNANSDVSGHSADTTIASPTKRKICFAPKPSVTTYHLDDEPWRVQNSSGETDETVKSLMDQTFQFFNSPSSSSSNSVCDYDGQDDDVAAAPTINTTTATMTNSTNKCDDDGGMETDLFKMNLSCDDDENQLKSFIISQQMLSASKTLSYKDGSTLYLKFAHTTTPAQPPLPPVMLADVDNTIKSPVDIYRHFGCDSAAAEAPNTATTNDFDIEKQKLKDYVLKVANLNTDELKEKMANYLAGKSTSSTLPNGNHASPVIKTPPVEPKKSILKNCEAVKREIRGKLFDQIEEDDPTQTFYTQDKCDPFIGFNQVLGDICERPPEVTNNNNNNDNNCCYNKSNAAAINGDASTQGKKRVSVFKLNRMS